MQEALKLKYDDFEIIYNIDQILAMLGEVKLANDYIGKLNEPECVKEEVRRDILT